MTALRKTILIGAMLLASATAFAEDAHHPAASAADAPPAASPEPAQQPGTPDTGMMMPGGMMPDGMMRMMMGMMSGGNRPMGPMEQMMSPEHVEGRIAFLRTELEVTDAQLPLWEAVAEALRANARAAKDMMAGMPGAMMSADTAPASPIERIDLQERMLSTRLEGLRRLKAALEPFYAALDDTQKAVADKLLVPAPMGMM